MPCVGIAYAMSLKERNFLEWEPFTNPNGGSCGGEEVRDTLKPIKKIFERSLMQHSYH